MGVFVGVTQLLVGGIVTIYSIRLLILCRDHTKIGSYEELAVFCFGPCEWPRVLSLHVHLSCLFTGMYLIVDAAI
jgi:hypothetical protein